MRRCVASTAIRGKLAISLVYRVPVGFVIPRQYIRRVNVLNAAAAGVVQVGNVLEWSQAGRFIHMVLAPLFYEWNSNHWPSTKVWDLASSFATIGGVPVDLALFFSVPFYPEDRGYNIAIHATNDLTVKLKGDLPCPPPDFWYDRCIGT